MQDISSLYRRLMRIGSIISLFFLSVGLIIRSVMANESIDIWSWRSSHLYLMIGIVSLLSTPVAGLVAFFIFSIKQKQYSMVALVVTLLVLLIGGTWIVHPGY